MVPVRERQDLIRRFHDSIFAGHLGVTRTIFRLLDRVYWPGLRGDVRTYIASCTICLARKSPCPRRAPMGHVEVGHRWERVAMDLLDMSVTTARGYRYVLVMVDCFSRWTEACPLPDKTAHSFFFNQVVCRFGMPIVIHSDQGQEFENKIMQELCILCGSHKTRTTPYHPESDGLVERFNRTLLMMLAMFAGKNREDWDDLLPAVMMAYRSSVHESTGFSPCRLMFGEECTLPMDIGLPKQQSDLPDYITSPYAIWVGDAMEVAYDQVLQHSGQAVQRQKRLYDRRAVKRLFAVGDWVMRYYTPAKKCKLDLAWIGPYLIVSRIGWALGIQKDPDSPIVTVHCQDLKKVPPPPGAVSWLTTKKLSIAPSVPILGASTMQRTSQSPPSLKVAVPAEGAIIADVDSEHSVGSSVAPSDTSGMDITSAPLISVPRPVESWVVQIDSSCVIHPYYIHKMDSEPVRLMTIAHAFNYRVAVLRDGVWTAVRVGRSRKAETCFLKEANISWGQQVTVMFQIVSTLMGEVPAFALRMRELQGESPDVQLKDDPWGHVEHCDANCACLESVRTEAYIHNLLPIPETFHLTSPNDDEMSGEVENGFMFNNDCGYLGVGRPGSIPFVSQKPGAYGRLLLAVYVRWKAGPLISSDWLRPVTRGVWRTVLPDRESNPNPVHGPVGTSRPGGWLCKGALTERRTIVTWRSSSTYKVIWIVLCLFRSKLCDFLPRHGGRLRQNRFVFVELYFGTNTMDVQGFALPIRTYQENLSKMRESNDPNGSEVTNLCSLGVVDLDLSLCTDVFGLKAFDEKMPITSMSPGSSPCKLRLLLPYTKIGKDGFHDVVVENLIGSSTWRSRHVSPADIIALRQRWPRAVFQMMKERSTELEDLRRQAFTGLQWAYRYAHPGYCPECKTKTDSSLESHMMCCHRGLGQLWRCPVE